MKPIYAHFGGALALTFAVAACVPAPDSTRAPEASPTQAPVTVTPTPAPQAVPLAENWIDQPQTAGDWAYAREEVGQTNRPYTSATFTSPRGETLLRLTCSSGNISISRPVTGTATSQMIIRTETATRSIVATPDREGRPSKAAVLRPDDPLLDAIALTRGRFAVEISGASALYLPAWAEVTRVIEDCR